MKGQLVRDLYIYIYLISLLGSAHSYAALNSAAMNMFAQKERKKPAENEVLNVKARRDKRWSIS